MYNTLFEEEPKQTKSIGLIDRQLISFYMSY